MSLDQFFTAPTLAKRIALWAKTIVSSCCSDVSRLRFLEPSAGRGDLIAGLLAVGIKPEQITAVELDREFSDGLKADFPGVTVIHDDFLNFNDLGRFDCVVANPPYSEGRTESHLRKAASISDLCVALVLSSTEFGTSKYQKLWNEHEITNRAHLINRPKFSGPSTSGHSAMHDYEVIAFRKMVTSRVPGQVTICRDEWWGRNDPLPVVV